MALAVSCLTVWVLVLSQLMSGGASLEPGFNFTVEPQDTIALKNTGVYLKCHASADSDEADIVYSWRKDGQTIDFSNVKKRFTLHKNGTLHIKRVIHRKQRLQSDEGFYECLAKLEPHALVSRKARLQVATLSRPSGDPRNVTAAVGEVARFHCSCHAFPRPRFKWWHNKEEISPEDARYSMLDSGVLIIHGVVPEDDGTVRCSASNIANPSGKSRDFRLTVTTDTSLQPIRLLSHEQNLHPLVGQSVDLECTASGLPKPILHWTHRNGSSVLENSRFSIRNGILRITKVQRSDSDNYQCIAENQGSVSKWTHEVNLDVYEPPKLMNYPAHVEERLSLTIRITCNFTGHPQLNISWQKDGKDVYPNGRIKRRPNGMGEVFVINNADVKDSGYYMCRAENSAGVVQYTTKVDMHSSVDTPTKPVRLTAEAISSTAIQLDWADTIVKEGQSLVAYSVHLLPQDIPNSVEKQKVAEVSELKIVDLVPNTNYSFYVVAYFSTGASPHSDTIYQRTMEGKPIAYPEVEVVENCPTSFKVKWQHLPVRKAQGVITRHELLYRKLGSTYSKVEELSGDIYEYLILGLEPDTEYEIRVKSGTKVGYSDLEEKDWPWITNRTPERQIECRGLLKMTLKALNLSAVLVTWSGETLDNKEAWRLTFISENGNKINKLFPVTTHNYIMNSLSPNTQYEVMLTPVYETGDGQPVSGIVTTPPNNTDGLLAPEGLEAMPLNATCIRVNWQYPATVEHVDYYMVRYNPVTSDDNPEGSSHEKFVTSDSLEKMIGHLEPYTQYELAVRAFVGETYGPYSKKVQCRTKPTFPGAPQHFQALIKQPGTIMLQWQPPKKTNGLIRAYNVLSSPSLKVPDDKWDVKVLNGTTNKIQLQGYKVGGTYYFKVTALTDLGAGPPTETELVYFPLASQNDTAPQNSPRDNEKPVTKDKELGIIVGVSIAGTCIIACIIFILFRNRCFPRESAENSTAQHDGAVCVRVNGNGYVPHGHGTINVPNESVELDSFTPMLTRLPENEHSDSKGGYGMYPNPGGLGLRATYMPNGHVTTFVTHQRPDDQGDSPQVPQRSSSMLNSHNTLSNNQSPSPQDQDCSIDEIDQSSDIEMEDANSEASPLNPGGEGDGGLTTDSSLQMGTPNTGSYNKRVPQTANLRGSSSTTDGVTDNLPGRDPDKNPTPVQGPTSCMQDHHVLPNKDAISDDASRSQCSLSEQGPSHSEGALTPSQAADERPRPPHRTANEPQNQVLV